MEQFYSAGENFHGNIIRLRVFLSLKLQCVEKPNTLPAGDHSFTR